MRFDTNSQLWVDDNGQPLVVQPPKPVGNDNGFSISANQAPVNFNVSNFANNPLPVTTSDGQQYQPQSFNFQTPDLNAGLQLPNDISAIDKQRLSQTANFNQAITDAGKSFTDTNINLTGGTTAPNNNQNGANNLFGAFSNMTQAYSLESSLYGLGSALGKKDYTGMTQQEISRSKGNDTLSAIGNAGKLLLGGTRSLLSGAAASHMNNWNINEYKKRRRDALVNNQPGVESAYAAVGGAPQYQDGGLVPPPISAELEGNPDTVYDFRPTTNGSVMSLLTGRPSGYDINPNVSQQSVDQAIQSLPQRRSGVVNNTNVVENSAPVNNSNYDSLNFRTAFNQAYNDKGEGQIFNWRGKAYLLNKNAKVNNNIVSRGSKEPVVKVVEKNTSTKKDSKSTELKKENKSDSRSLSQSEIDRLKALFKRNGVTTSNYIIPGWRKDSQVMNLQNPLIKYQDGGEVVNDDLMAQLQQAVDSGDMTPEEAQAYLQQGGQDEQEQSQETPNVNDIQGQLMQAVQNGEISEEEANAYLQQVQQEPQPQSPQAPQQSQQEPQMTPDEAQAQLAQAVQSGEITQEEAQTYLQQLYGDSVDPNSQPIDPYTGAVREKIKPEEYLTGEVTTGDENKPYNSEVEKGEYINRNGVTQQVVGDKHSSGGEKMNLEKGTIIISDNKRLGSTNARALSLQTGLKLKAGDTYSQVVDIFNKKIGLDKLNSEQEDLFKKLEKVGDQGNQTTQQLNNEFLNAKINDIEQKKKGLLSQREQLVQVLFELQENDKKQEPATSEVPEYQDGGRVGEYVLDRYGKDAYQYYLDNWKNDPNYNFRDYAQMRERLKGFASDYNVPIPEGFDRYNEAQMDAFAGQLQKNVPNEVATHYGTYVAPTQSGLQWLVDKGVVDKNNDALKKIIKNGKVTVGSYGSLDKGQQQVIADAVDNLDPETLNQYSTANFRDSKWFYRRPKEETIYYRDKDEFDNVINSSPKVGDGVFFSGKSGAYFRPRLLQEKILGSQKEVDDYIKQYGKNPDKVHKDFLSEGDPMVYNLVRAQDPAPATEPTPNNLGNLGRKVRRNNFLLPDQSTLPPEALRSVPKYDIRYNYLDNIRLSPEQNLLENYRAYDEARAKMEGLPDTTNQANLAMLTGNVAQANNQAINQINAQNVQNAQQVAQANLGTLNRQAEMDLNLADQYDQRMNRALDVTRKDIEGYYDFNRRVNVGEFNTRHQLTLLNDLFNNYGINPDGSIGFDPKTTTPYSVDRFEAIRAQQLQEELKRRKQAASTTQTATKTKVSDNWGK